MSCAPAVRQGEALQKDQKPKPVKRGTRSTQGSSSQSKRRKVVVSPYMICISVHDPNKFCIYHIKKCIHIHAHFEYIVNSYPNIFCIRSEYKNVQNPKLSFQVDDDDKSYHPESSENESSDEGDHTEDDILKLTTAVPTAGTSGVDSQLNLKRDLELDMQFLVIVMPSDSRHNQLLNFFFSMHRNR